MISFRNVFSGAIGMCVPTAILYLDGYWNVQLVVLIAAMWGIGGWSLSQHVSVWEQMDNKAGILTVFLLVAVPPLGIHAHLPISADLRIALWYLFAGAGLSFWGLGIQMVSKTLSNQYQQSTTSID